MATKEPVVRLPQWVVILLVGVIITALTTGASVIYTAGQTTATIRELANHIESLEQRLQSMEKGLIKK